MNRKTLFAIAATTFISLISLQAQEPQNNNLLKGCLHEFSPNWTDLWLAKKEREVRLVLGNFTENVSASQKNKNLAYDIIKRIPRLEQKRNHAHLMGCAKENHLKELREGNKLLTDYMKILKECQLIFANDAFKSTNFTDIKELASTSTLVVKEMYILARIVAENDREIKAVESGQDAWSENKRQTLQELSSVL